MDQLDAPFPNLDYPSERVVEARILNKITLVRCDCGRVIDISIPSICKCGDHKLYWKMINGKTKRLSEMDLSHLSNCVKMLAEKIEGKEGRERARLETAMDLLYLEIQSRDKELAQMAGMERALKEALSAG